MSVRSVPERDLALLRPRSYRAALPTSDDVLLVVEVTDSSLRRHRDLKSPMYAYASIPEYWIVNVQEIFA